MMILRTSPASPFGRKVRLAAANLGLTDEIEIVQTDTNDPANGLSDANPLGKIPVLTLADGTSYYDSRVIVEYLDDLAGGGALIPAAPAARFRQLTFAALADGIMEASLLQVYELRLRDPARQDPAYLDRQAVKVARGLAVFEAAAPTTRGVAAIGLAAALGYLDLRFHGGWRAAHPTLTRWLEGFSTTTPAFAATAA